MTILSIIQKVQTIKRLITAIYDLPKTSIRTIIGNQKLPKIAKETEDNMPRFFYSLYKFCPCNILKKTK